MLTNPSNDANHMSKIDLQIKSKINDCQVQPEKDVNHKSKHDYNIAFQHITFVKIIIIVVVVVIIIITKICAAEMAVRYAALSACRKVQICPQCVPKSTSVTLAVDEKTLPMATITGRTDRQTDRQSATKYAAPS